VSSCGYSHRCGYGHHCGRAFYQNILTSARNAEVMCEMQASFAKMPKSLRTDWFQEAPVADARDAERQ